MYLSKLQLYRVIKIDLVWTKTDGRFYMLLRQQLQ